MHIAWWLTLYIQLVTTAVMLFGGGGLGLEWCGNYTDDRLDEFKEFLCLEFLIYPII